MQGLIGCIGFGHSCLSDALLCGHLSSAAPLGPYSYSLQASQPTCPVSRLEQFTVSSVQDGLQVLDFDSRPFGLFNIDRHSELVFTCANMSLRKTNHYSIVSYIHPIGAPGISPFPMLTVRLCCRRFANVQNQAFLIRNVMLQQPRRVSFVIQSLIIHGMPFEDLFWRQWSQWYFHQQRHSRHRCPE